MSRDGYLPPGCTELDVDRACPGYDDPPEFEDEPEVPTCGLCGKKIWEDQSREDYHGDLCHPVCVEIDIQENWKYR